MTMPNGFREMESNTYFARHTQNLDIDTASRQELWEEDRIAIHYPDRHDGDPLKTDNVSLDVNDYPPKSAARNVVGKMVELAENGGYICAEYFPNDQIKIGYISPKSKIEIAEKRRGSEVKPAMLKTLRIESPRILRPIQTAFVLAGRPRQGTLVRWSACGHRIRDLVLETSSTLGLDDLLPYEQEIMCSEFLRLPRAVELGLPRLSNLLMPVGKTMKDADLFGITADGQVLVGQVTWHKESDSKDKFEALKKYFESAKSVAVFFCKTDTSRIRDGVHIFPLQQVFAEFSATSVGALWLASIRPA